MTTNYKTETFDKAHRHFGGYVVPSDFNTEYRCNNAKNGKGSCIAQRIAEDFEWEKKLILNKKKRENTYGKH